MLRMTLSRPRQSRRGHFVMESGALRPVVRSRRLVRRSGRARSVRHQARAMLRRQTSRSSAVRRPAAPGSRNASRDSSAATSHSPSPGRAIRRAVQGPLSFCRRVRRALREARRARRRRDERGSSLRATLTEVEAHGARPVVIGALHVLGGRGRLFPAARPSVETSAAAISICGARRVPVVRRRRAARRSSCPDDADRHSSPGRSRAPRRARASDRTHALRMGGAR